MGDLASYLRNININTGNNLCVIGAACYGLRAIMPLSLTEASPFYVLLAPEEAVLLGFLASNIPPFYRMLFECGSIDSSYSRYLSDKFKFFHCEKMLFIVIAKYINEQCRGKGARERREKLLTEIFSHGAEKTPEKLKEIRAALKSGLKPDQLLLDRYANKFLIGRQCSFNMGELLQFLDENIT